MSCSMSVLYFSPQRLVTDSKNIPLRLSVPLPVPLYAPAPADSSLVPLKDTLEPPASKSIRDFKYVYTHRQKVSASEPTPADLSLEDDHSLQLSASLSDLDIPIALRKDN